MTKKATNLRILIGLPGSGKTCFAKKLARNPGVVVFGENERQDKDWRIYKRNSGKRYAPMSSEELFQNVSAFGQPAGTFIMDGLFLSTERVLEAIRAASTAYQLKTVTLDYWPENKEECLRNDYLRRRIGSSLSIRNLSICVDFDEIRRSYPQMRVKYHTVYHTPDWAIFFRPYLPLENEEILRSDDWVIGGESYDLDGNSYPITPDEPIVKFRELDILLMKICPNLPYLQYQEIFSDCVTVSEEEESDYYTRCTKRFFVCNLRKVYEKLDEFGFIPTAGEDSLHLMPEDMDLLRELARKDVSEMTDIERIAWKLYVNIRT